MSISHFEALTSKLLDDPDRDVSVEGRTLLVHGRKFAYLDEAALAVQLSAERSNDLVQRGVAKPVPAQLSNTGQWVRVFDPEDWSELVAEAHELAQGRMHGNAS